MKVSVFMPITNPTKRGDTFIEAIKTHLYWADEMIIVDGGSTDGSLEKILALNEPRIKIITRPWPQQNWSWVEFPKAWNAGLQACTGDWVAAGESDHIFHENEAERMRNELEERLNRGLGVLTLNKLQSGAYDKWYSKSKMYYFINKRDYPQICYGFDPDFLTDLCQPIVWDGITNFEGLPQGKAVLEHQETKELVHTIGPMLYNYLWTFKTMDMIMNERRASMRAWNQFEGFTKVHGRRFSETEDDIEQMIIDKLRGIDDRGTKIIPFDQHPQVMREKITHELKEGMLGLGVEQCIAYYLKHKNDSL